MVYIYRCSACEQNKHVECEIDHIAASPNVIGGRHCVCPCRGRTSEQIEEDWERYYKKIMGSDDR